MTTDSMDTDDKMYWKLQRIQKKIKLTEMAESVGCSYNLLSMFENNRSSMVADKIARYKEYIETR